MKLINEQRLKLWLSGNVVAYNNGSTQDIEMVKELCKRTSDSNKPWGASPYYYCERGVWFAAPSCAPTPSHPVSWFFEPENAPEQLKCSLDRDETARMILLALIGKVEVLAETDLTGKAVTLTDKLIKQLSQPQNPDTTA